MINFNYQVERNQNSMLQVNNLKLIFTKILYIVSKNNKDIEPEECSIRGNEWLVV